MSSALTESIRLSLIRSLSFQLIHSRAFVHILDYLQPHDVLCQMQYICTDMYNYFVPQYCIYSNRPHLRTLPVCSQATRQVVLLPEDCFVRLRSGPDYRQGPIIKQEDNLLPVIYQHKCSKVFSVSGSPFCFVVGQTLNESIWLREVSVLNKETGAIKFVFQADPLANQMQTQIVGANLYTLTSFPSTSGFHLQLDSIRVDPASRQSISVFRTGSLMMQAVTSNTHLVSTQNRWLYVFDLNCGLTVSRHDTLCH